MNRAKRKKKKVVMKGYIFKGSVNILYIYKITE